MPLQFDPRETDLRLGVEIEYPKVDDGERLVNRGGSTSSLQTHLNTVDAPDARPVYDATVGLEIVSEPLPPEDVPSWYAGVVNTIEENHKREYQPVGLMRGGNTAGTHVHVSPLTQDEAVELAELSSEPWLQVLFCSSIAKNADSGEITWPVFRGGRYCQLHYADGSRGDDHYAVVNRCGHDHYEWRLPEPMVKEHVEILVNFLALFKQDTELAIEYAQEKLDDGDDRITSVRRAEAIGMDLDAMPDVRREPSPNDPENFYEAVATNWMLPEIQTVELHGNEYYAFDTRLTGEFEVEGVRFNSDDILHADSLEPVTDSELRQNVQSAFRRGNGDARRETQATDELKKIIKKK